MPGGGAWGGCPAGLPQRAGTRAHTQRRGIPAPRLPPAPLGAASGMREPHPAGRGLRCQRGAAGTSPPSITLGGRWGAGSPPAQHGMGQTQPWCGPSAVPAPLQGWHPLTPKTGKEERDPCRQDAPQETSTRAGWGREEALPPGLVPSHTSATPSPRTGTRVCTATRAHPDTGTRAPCVHTLPRARWAPVGAAPPPTLPHPRSHTPAMGAGSPSLPGPPRSPAAAVPVYGDGAACPALPAPGGATGASLVLLPLPCLAPVLMGSRLTAAWDHPTDARPRPVLGTAAGNPDREKSWTPGGAGMGRVPPSCCVWSVGAPARHFQTRRCRDVPAPLDPPAGAEPPAQWGARGMFYARGPGVSQGAEGGIQPWAGPTVPHSPAPSHAVRSQAQLIPAPDLWGN